jgi:hypothetical protein
MRKRIDEYTGAISLGNLINGFEDYVRVLGAIFRNITSYPKTLTSNETVEFRRGIRFIVFAIVLSFFITIPVYIYHKESVTKLVFFVRMIVNYVIWGLMLHYSLRIFGARNVTMKHTLTIYSYIMGIGLPSYLLLSLPILISFGPNIMFGSFDDAYSTGVQYGIEHADDKNFLFLFWYQNISLVFLGYFLLFIMLFWISRSHGISKKRVFLSIVSIGILGSIIQGFILNPFFNTLYGVLDYWIDLFF